jgi:hypothetical protein
MDRQGADKYRREEKIGGAVQVADIDRRRTAGILQAGNCPFYEHNRFERMTEMRQVLLKGFAVLLFTNVIALIAGCEEANQSDVKKHRLIATENRQLRAQLQAETQRQDKEIQNQKDQLAKCEKEKQDWQQKVEQEKQDCLQRIDKEKQNWQQNAEKEKQDWQQSVEEEIKDQSNAVLTDVIEQLAKLREENDRLKAEIEQLKSKTGRSE